VEEAGAVAEIAMPSEPIRDVREGLAVDDDEVS